MVILFVIFAGFLLIGLVGVSMSLMDLDKRLLDLVKAMDGRYGAWMQQAESKKKKKDDKNTAAATAAAMAGTLAAKKT